jgi:hypothetical protein
MKSFKHFFIESLDESVKIHNDQDIDYHIERTKEKKVTSKHPGYKTEETEISEGYNDPEYVRRAIPALKKAVEFHKDMMKDHDKKSVKGSPEYVRAHSAAAKAHKEAAERHHIAHAQLSVGSKDVEYYVKPARELGAYAEKLSDKANRLKEEVEIEEGTESWEAGYKRRVVKTTSPEHKEKGMNWRIKGKDRPEISIKLYKEKPSQEEFNKQMRRVAGHEFGG